MDSGTDDKVRGKGEELLGKAKSSLGDATGNERLQRDGMLDQAQGQARQTEGGIKGALDTIGDKLGDVVDKVTGNDADPARRDRNPLD